MPKFKTSETGERKLKHEQMSPEFEQKLREIMKTKDMDKITAFFLANRDYIKRTTPPSTRTTVSDEQFEEIAAAYARHDWESYHDLTCDLTWEARDELQDRLRKRGIWLKVQLEEGKAIFQKNLPIIQQYSSNLQEALEVYIIDGDLSTAASIAQMNSLDFYQFVRSLHLNFT